MRVVHWFRNDLRLRDNTALAAACTRATELIPVFVIDPALLAIHDSPARRAFLADCLRQLAHSLAGQRCPLVVEQGEPAAVLRRLLVERRADLLTFNRDESPYARRRDARVRAAARAAGVAVEDHADRTIFAPDALRTAAGAGFRVYTPFRQQWWARYRAAPPPIGGAARLPRRRSDTPAGLDSNGRDLVTRLAPDDRPGAQRLPPGGEDAARRRLNRFVVGGLRQYARDRDRPALDGTSRLSPYLRLGAVSARECVALALAHAAHDRRAGDGAQKWVDELVWREFYLALLAEHGRVLRGPFRREFAAVEWNEDREGFAAWRDGRTGYPFVDAAMRQLARDGWMHNRGRMAVASFLAKDLLIDWRLGERLFMQRLVDGDPAVNNGGWQWAASTGTDPQPYFRIFNPILQGARFDPDGGYIREFVPELRDVPNRYLHRPWQAPSPPPDYPPPIVDHAERRVAAIARYDAARTQVDRRRP